MLPREGRGGLRYSVRRGKLARVAAEGASTDLRGRTALITGASAGIGRAFAREYARRGVRPILLARRAERLRALAGELAAAHGVRAEVLVADLADPGAPAAVEAELLARDLTVDILVNNAGYGVAGTFLASDWRTHADFLQVMLTAVAELSHRFLPAMRERGFGRIINVASLAGHLPATAGHTLYIPVKAWMIRFSEALAFELAGSGVHVCAVCPGFTYSEFHDVAGTRELVARLPKSMWMDAEAVARQGVAAAERGEVVYINGRLNRLIAQLARLLPRRLAYRAVAARSAQFRKR